jgi:hypothetical protein
MPCVNVQTVHTVQTMGMRYHVRRNDGPDGQRIRTLMDVFGAQRDCSTYRCRYRSIDNCPGATPLEEVLCDRESINTRVTQNIGYLKYFRVFTQTKELNAAKLLV